VGFFCGGRALPSAYPPPPPGLESGARLAGMADETGLSTKPRAAPLWIAGLAIAAGFAAGCSGLGASPAGSGSGSGSGVGIGGVCSSNAECNLPGQLRYCWAGGPLGCPDGYSLNCTKDSDCADAGQICLNLQSSGQCSGPAPLLAATQCGPKCGGVADCPVTSPPGGLACLPSGHCGAIKCAGADGCPVDYACLDDACQVKPCTSDSECSVACVNGQCAAQMGKCEGEES
jgi:hypothetical protein